MPDHWGHTAPRLAAPPAGPTHVLVATFPTGQPRGAGWAALRARANADPRCVGEPLGFTTRFLPAPKDAVRPLEVSVYWPAEAGA